MLHQGTPLTEVLFAHFDKNVQMLQVNHDRNGRRKEKKCESGIMAPVGTITPASDEDISFFFYTFYFWLKKPKPGGYTRTVYLQTGKHTKWAETFIWCLLLINTKWAETFTRCLLLIFIVVYMKLLPWMMDASSVLNNLGRLRVNRVREWCDQNVNVFIIRFPAPL